MDAASIAPAEPPPSEERPLTESDLLRFIYTCPQALVMTSLHGRARLMSAGAVALLVPLSDSGSIDDVFALLEQHAPDFGERLRGAMAGPLRRLSGLRINCDAAPPRPASWLEVSAVPFDDGYALALQDVTAAVDQEARYRAAIAEEAHQRGKIETAVGILHDLGNALTGIGGCVVEARRVSGDAAVAQNLGRTATFLRPHEAALSTLLGAGRGKALVELFASMASAAERAQREALGHLEKITAYLTHAQEILAIQRAYAGAGADASEGRVSVERMLLDVQSMTAHLVEKRGGVMLIAPRTARLPEVRADRSKLMQVLLNLVKNAAEAMDELPPGSAPEVSLSAALTGDGGLSIAVRDTGPGFSRERGERLFEHGYSTKERGSGVGLGACRRIIESFGGGLTVTSGGSGEGALARIVLPREIVS